MPQSSNETKPTNLIVVGLPREETLESLLSQEAESIVLVEAEPDRAVQLARRFENDPRIRVMTGVIGTDAGQAELVRYNFPGLRSILEPTDALRDALPGLRSEARVQVPVITLETLLDKMGAIEGTVHLHIQTSGAELAILDAWKSQGDLRNIDRLFIHCGTEPMFDGATGYGELRDWALENGFLLGAEDSNDPDWRNLDLRANLAARELEDMRARVAALEQTLVSKNSALAQAETRGKEQAGQIDGLTGKLERKLAALEQAESAARDATARIEALTAGLADKDSAIEKAETHAQEQSAKIEGLEQELAQSSDALKRTRGTAHEHVKKIEELESQIAEKNGALTEAETRSKDLHARVEELQNALKEKSDALQKTEVRAKEQARKIDELGSELKEKSDALEKAEAGSNELRAQIDTLRKELAEKSDAQKKSDAHAQEQAKTIEALTSQMQDASAALETAEAGSKQLRAQVDTVQEELSKAADARANAEARAKEQAEKVATLTSDLAEKSAALDEAETRVNQLTAKIDTLEAAADRDAKALEAAKSDLAVALRMQVVAQSDLRDLQSRFRRSEEARRTQENLLQQLTPRLQQASEQLSLLVQKEDIGIDAAMAVEAQPSKPVRRRKTTKTETKPRSKR